MQNHSDLWLSLLTGIGTTKQKRVRVDHVSLGPVRDPECTVPTVLPVHEERFVDRFLEAARTELYRRQYRAEREHPEWIDLGGES